MFMRDHAYLPTHARLRMNGIDAGDRFSLIRFRASTQAHKGEGGYCRNHKRPRRWHENLSVGGMAH